MVNVTAKRVTITFYSVATVYFLRFNTAQQIPPPTMGSRNMPEGAEDDAGGTTAAANTSEPKGRATWGKGHPSQGTGSALNPRGGSHAGV